MADFPTSTPWSERQTDILVDDLFIMHLTHDFCSLSTGILVYIKKVHGNVRPSKRSR